MKTEFKEVAHLYLGTYCEFKVSGFDAIHEEYGILYRMPISGTEWGIYCPEEDFHHTAFIHDIKPVLRPLSDMTDEEAIEVAKMGDEILELCIKNEDPEVIRDSHLIQVCYTDYDAKLGHQKKRFMIHLKQKFLTHQTPIYNFQYITAYLCKQNFDLFNLIENGYAIDKTTLK